MTEYTKEQEVIVEKILSIDKNDYYKILHVEKSASDIEIKKSYRKLAIKLHPDKNQHPKSSDAFKRLAKLFEVLSDAEKKRIFDQTGFDPDSRGAGMSSGFSGASASSPFGNAGHPFMRTGGGLGGPQAFDAEDILNFMFGGGGAQGGASPFSTFNTGNGFSFQFGGPGFDQGSPFSFFGQQQLHQSQRRRQEQQQRTQQRQRQRQQPQSPVDQLRDSIKQILPFILLFLIPLISSLFSSDDTTSATGARLPKFSFELQPSLPIQRLTSKYKIPYYINEKTFTNNGGYQDPDSPLLKTLDKRVENQYVNDLKFRCHRENLLKQEAIEDSTFLWMTNQRQLAEAKAMVTPSCDRLSDLGLL